MHRRVGTCNGTSPLYKRRAFLRPVAQAYSKNPPAPRADGLNPRCEAEIEGEITRPHVLTTPVNSRSPSQRACLTGGLLLASLERRSSDRQWRPTCSTRTGPRVSTENQTRSNERTAHHPHFRRARPSLTLGPSLEPRSSLARATQCMLIDLFSSSSCALAGVDEQ